jgi:NADPH:quinone reductase-like Zn-dependent oxidoreductase
MKAVRFHEFGDTSVLHYEDAPDPTASEWEVLLRVRACALNGLDIYARTGGLEEAITLPHIPGADIAGEVVSVGSKVNHIRVGERAMVNPRSFCGTCEFCLAGRQTGCIAYSVIGWHRPGGYAELVTVPATNIEPIPADLSFAEAAAVPMVFTTAWRLLFDRAQLKPDETILVLSASGGVANAAVQLAHEAGARVIATTVTEKVDRVRESGADWVIDHSRESVSGRVQSLTSGRGVDVLVQTQGGDSWAQGLDCMAKFGRIVVCAAVRGAAPVEDLGTIWWKQLTIVGSTGGSPLDFQHVVSYINMNRIRPTVDSVYPLQDAAKAQRLFSAHQHVGKIVLQP